MQDAHYDQEDNDILRVIRRISLHLTTLMKKISVEIVPTICLRFVRSAEYSVLLCGEVVTAV